MMGLLLHKTLEDSLGKMVHLLNFLTYKCWFSIKTAKRSEC